MLAKLFGTICIFLAGNFVAQFSALVALTQMRGKKNRIDESQDHTSKTFQYTWTVYTRILYDLRMFMNAKTFDSYRKVVDQNKPFESCARNSNILGIFYLYSFKIQLHRQLSSNIGNS